MYTESDIKWEGKHFFVVRNGERKRYDICKKGVCASVVAGWRDLNDPESLTKCIRTAQRLELYPTSVVNPY